MRLEEKRKEHYEKYIKVCEESCGKSRDKLPAGEEVPVGLPQRDCPYA